MLKNLLKTGFGLRCHRCGVNRGRTERDRTWSWSSHFVEGLGYIGGASGYKSTYEGSCNIREGTGNISRRSGNIGKCWEDQGIL